MVAQLPKTGRLNGHVRRAFHYRAADRFDASTHGVPDPRATPLDPRQHRHEMRERGVLALYERVADRAPERL